MFEIYSQGYREPSKSLDKCTHKEECSDFHVEELEDGGKKRSNTRDQLGDLAVTLWI